MESFWGSLKNELVHHCRYATRAEAQASIREYIEIFYNRQRRHSRLGLYCAGRVRPEFQQTAGSRLRWEYLLLTPLMPITELNNHIPGPLNGGPGYSQTTPCMAAESDGRFLKNRATERWSMAGTGSLVSPTARKAKRKCSGREYSFRLGRIPGFYVQRCQVFPRGWSIQNSHIRRGHFRPEISTGICKNR